ncbi:MAG TPA: lipid II flippase MurJ [Anaerolineales bacterium]|nr:lipid II flippase MurJ [Anaerolineales bacterium]
MTRLTFLTRTTLLLSFFFAADKVLAFGKSLLFNKIVGLEGMGIFGAANNIPDYLSALLSGGALGIALVPILRETLDRQGRAAAWALFARVLNLAFIVTGLASIAIILLAEPFVQRVIAPGFSVADQALTISLMRLDLVAILIFSISGLVMAGLHANQHFLLPAMAPLFYNLGQLFGVTILSPSEGLHIGAWQLPHFGLGLYGLVYGVIIGASLHLLIQVPALIRYQFHWEPVIEFRSAAIQRVLLLLGPRVLTMACIQAYFVARDSLGSRFNAVGVGAMNLAWTIEQVPETIIGSAMAVALLPSLATFIDQRDFGTFTSTVNRALRVMLALCLPAAVLIGMTVRPLAQAFFGFEPARLELLTFCTWAFLLGLVGDTWLEVAVRSHYANLDTRTPLIAAFFQVTAFVLLSILLPRWIGLPGIPLAAAITFTTQALILLALMNRRYPGLLDVASTAWRAVLAAAAAGAAGFAALRYLPLGGAAVAMVALLAGAAVAVPIVWRELRMLMRL